MTTKAAPKKAAAKKAVKPAAKPAAKAAPAKPLVRKAVAPAAKASSLYEEFCTAANTTVHKGESFAQFSVRLCEGVSKLSDQEFGKLSKTAQTWFNDTADAINRGEAGVSDIPVMSGFPGAAKAPAPAAIAAAPAAPKAPKQATLPGFAAGGKARTEGVAHKVRLSVVKKPAISFEDAAGKAGVEAKIGSHAWNIWNEAKRVMELVTAQQAA